MAKQPVTDAPARDPRFWAGGVPNAVVLASAARAADATGDALPPRRPGSIPKLQRMIGRRHDDFPLYKRLTQILIKFDRLPEADETLDKALARRPRHTGLLLLKADVLAAGGGTDAALAVLRALPPTTGKLRVDRVAAETAILIEAGRLDEAMRLLHETLAVTPDEVVLLRRLGQIAAKLGDWDRTVEILEPLLLAGHALAREAVTLGAVLIEKLHQFERGWRAYCNVYPKLLVDDLHVRAFFETSSLAWVRTNSVLAGGEGGYEPEGVRRLEERLLHSIDAREPLALIRLLDGEGRTFSGADPSLDGAVFAEGRMEPLDADAMAQFQGLFMRAVKDADILGLLNESMVRNPYNRSVIHHLDGTVMARIRGDQLTIVDQPCHFQMLLAGSYERLLRGRDFVGVISGRDVTPHLKSAFGVREVAWHPLPAQARHDGVGPVAHYPDRYRELLAGLVVPHPGAVFLVGAGIVGKVYCAEVKRRGGIAIDIGAVADIWAGRLDTRPFSVRNLHAANADDAPDDQDP